MSEPRAWERPDGTLVIRQVDDVPLVEWIDEHFEPPSDAVPLRPVPEVVVVETDEIGGVLMRLISATQMLIREVEDPGVEALGALYEARRVARHRAVDTPGAAPTRDALTRAANARLDELPGIEEASARRVMSETITAVLGVLRGGGADGGGEDEDVADPCMEDARGRCGTPGHDHAGSQCARCGLPRRYEPDPDDLCLICRNIAGPPRSVLARLAAAAGVSPDSEDVVGAIEAAIRAGREPEVVTGAEANALPPGSIVSQWVNGRPVDALTHYFSGWARSGATRWGVHENLDSGSGAEWVVWYRAPEQQPESPDPLQLGDVVTGDRAVSAPVGTTLRAKSAAMAAVHTVNGWSVTGMGREQDHEETVRVNEWVVLALPEAQS